MLSKIGGALLDAVHWGDEHLPWYVKWLIIGSLLAIGGVLGDPYTF